MNTVKDVLARDLSKRIEEVIKVDQADEATVHGELSDYVATVHISDKYRELFRAFADAQSEPSEGVGIWVSGFFGSGKSSFAKNLGYAVANPRVLGEHAADLFKTRVPDRQVGEFLDFIHASHKTDVIMFDVSVDLKIKDGAERIAEVMYTALLRELGYAEDYDIADLEIGLEQEGRLEQFVARCKEKYNQHWKTARKGAEKFSRASALLHEIDPNTYSTPDSWWQSLRGKSADITVGDFVKRTFDLFSKRRPGHGLVYVIDEVGQYVARSADKIENLRAVVEQFGIQSKNRTKSKQAAAPVWIVVTSQEKLDEIVDAIGSKRVEIAKLQDRFRYRVDLAPEDISEVATRRVLLKKPESEDVLNQLFRENSGQLNNALRLERTTRGSAVSLDDFIQFYPYPPHFIDLSIDIMSGIRLQPGAPKQLGGSNRTIIKQAHEVLVSERTKLGDKPIGSLVTLDLIFELVEGNLSSEKQKDISDIKQQFTHNKDDRGMAIRVAKALALLEFVRNLPRTASNIAACLVTRVGESSPAVEVLESLKRLEASQFVRETEEGWKLQTAQEKNWETERRQHLSPRPKDRNDIVRESLRGIFGEAALRNYKKIKTFKVGAYLDSFRITEEGDISVYLSHDSATELSAKVDEVRQESRQEANKYNLYYAFPLTTDIDEIVANIYASQEMVAKYEHIRAQSKINAEDSSALQSEKSSVSKRKAYLHDKLLTALTAGHTIFRGVVKDAGTLGNSAEQIFHQFFEYAMPELYPKLEMGARSLKGTEADEFLKASNLTALPQIFYGGQTGLNLVVKEDGKYVPNPNADISREVLDYIRLEHSYGNKVTGRMLDERFQGIGYGWDREVLRLVLAVLLRAGAVEVTYQGRRYRNHQDPQSREIFSGVAAFRSASFAPRAAIELKTLTTAVQYLEDLIGEEVEIEEGAIASAFKKFADAESRSLLGTAAIVSAHSLPVGDVIRDYSQTLNTILSAPSDDCVRILAGEGRSFKATREVARAIHRATSDDALGIMDFARIAVTQIWPAASSHASGEVELAVERLKDLINSPWYYENIGEMDALTSVIVASYHGWYSTLHKARDDNYISLVNDIKGRPEWMQVDLDTQRALLEPLLSHCCEALSLTRGSVSCMHCLSSPRELIADIDARGERLQITIDRLIALATPAYAATHPREERVRVSRFFDRALNSRESVDKAVEELRRHLQELVATGAIVIVE